MKILTRIRTVENKDSLTTKFQSFMFKKMFLLGTISAALLFTACEKDSDGDLINGLNETDQNFTAAAARSNTAEIQLSQLALDNTINDTIRAYAQMMIDQHQMAQDELDSIASSVHFDIPHDVDQAHLDLKARLDTLNGYSFDTAFLNSQLVDHMATINLLQNQTTAGENAGLKNYASKYLPIVQGHRSMADSILNLIQ